MRRPPTLPIVLAGFAAFLDLYATQPLLPLLSRMFDASHVRGQPDVTAPTVAVAHRGAVVGRLADRFGLRRIIVGVGHGLDDRDRAGRDRDDSLAQLIFWRFVQGVATPGIFASTVAYVHEVWPASHAPAGRPPRT